MGRLRLGDWRREQLSAGVIVLLAVLAGGIVHFYAVTAYQDSPLLQAPGESCVIDSREEFQRLVSSSEYAAVMFSSDTCPVCRQMEPHWRRLCLQGGEVEYAILKLNRDTYSLYVDYGVLETPTFIVFRGGEPVARHTGGFPAAHGATVAETMREWVEASLSLTGSEQLRLLNASCGSCHPTPASMEPEAVREWLESNRGDALVDAMLRAYTLGATLSQAYNGTSGLIHLILAMNESLTLEEAERIALTLDAMLINARGGGASTPVGEAPPAEGQEAPAGGEAALQALGTAAGLVAGLLAAFSPCVFPLLASYTAMLHARGGGYSGAGAAVKSALAAAAGVVSVGLLFMALGGAVQEASRVLLPAAALTLTAAGILGYMDVPTFVNVGVRGRRGLLGFSFLYGLLAVQCSFPLVAGTLLLLASGGLREGLPVLAAFTVGIAAPVGLAVYASGRGRLAAALARLSSKKTLRYANLALAAAGAAMLAYTLGIV